VSNYAKKLCITAKHLSAVVKNVSGQSPTDIINSYVILDAKISLTTTDMTIQEISARLHFPNQSFFGRYFKQHTGLSPRQYRKNQQV
jgi:AraC-like DNA-binding protein